MKSIEMKLQQKQGRWEQSKTNIKYSEVWHMQRIGHVEEEERIKKWIKKYIKEEIKEEIKKQIKEAIKEEIKEEIKK